MTTLKLTVAAGTIMTLMGCASEDIDDGDDLLDSDVASAQQAVFTTYRDCSDPMVHPSQPGGDLVVTRDMNFNITSSTTPPTTCAVMGILSEPTPGVFEEVIGSANLSAASTTGGVTCGLCTSFYGLPAGGTGINNPPPLPGPPPAEPSRSSTVETVLIGETLNLPESFYHLGPTSGTPSSYCPMHGLGWWGGVTNVYGREVVITSRGTAWGGHAYQAEISAGKTAMTNVVYFATSKSGGNYWLVPTRSTSDDCLP